MSFVKARKSQAKLRLARRVERAMRAARFRTARHCHSLEVRLCRVGESPWATSVSGSTDPRNVGLPNSYSRKAYSVATSDHEVRVDRRALEAVRASGCGVVYLTDHLRVVQSRGTSLAVEQQVEGARGLRWVRAR